MEKQKRTAKQSMLEGMTGGIFLIGLGILFWTGAFWPWILLLIGIVSVPGSMAKDGFWAGLQGLIWMGGLAILFHLEVIWPGILILVGLSAMASALVRPGGEKRKRDQMVDMDEDYVTR